MTDFEKRKNEYLAKLHENDELLDKIKRDNVNNEEGQRTIALIENPKDEKELMACEIMLSMAEDSYTILESYANEKLEEIPLEDNYGIAFVINAINSLKEGKEVGHTNIKPKEAAKIVYSIIVGYLFNIEEAMLYIGRKTGYDLIDIEQTQKFNELYYNTMLMTKEINASKKDLSECTMEDLYEAQEFASEHHKLVEKGIKKEEPGFTYKKERNRG